MSLNGTFEEETDMEIIAGARLMVEHIEGITSYIISDHSMNLLEEARGQLPEGKNAVLAVYDRYLELPEKDQLIFSLGKRWGLFRVLSDLKDQTRYARAAVVVEQLQKEGTYKGTLSELKNLVI
jgi:hypothetical protein